jgi:hypothetical protein
MLVVLVVLVVLGLGGQENTRMNNRDLPRRPHTVVTIFALLGLVASGLLVALVVRWPVPATPAVDAQHAMTALLISLTALLVVSLLFLVWYLSPHLVHRVVVLRPLNSAVPPGTSLKQRTFHVRATPPALRLVVRATLTALYLAPVVAVILVVPTPVTLWRLNVVRLLDGVAALCTFCGMGYLVWRWLYVRAHPRA